MTYTMKSLISAGVLAAGLAIIPAPAMAQLGVDLGVDADVNVGVRSERPAPRHHHGHYTYRGYASHEWHHPPSHRRDRVWYDRHNGYDCYEAFQYTYEDGDRVRYTSTFCYDERDRVSERRDTRVVVRID